MINSQMCIRDSDNVMNRQREIIYEQRQQVLNGENIHPQILLMIDEILEAVLVAYTSDQFVENWDIQGLKIAFQHIFFPDESFDFIDSANTRDEVKNKVSAFISKYFERTTITLGEESLVEIERQILLKIVDMAWMDHIDNMEQLKQGISLRSYGQNDPVKEYTKEGFAMFSEMIGEIQENTIRYLMQI